MAEQTNVAEQPEPTGTWTAYPSLLPSLSPEARTALEDAACAHYCGRYKYAHLVFVNRLPLPQSNILVCLQKADMLTHQGVQLERIGLLEQAINTLKDSCNASEYLLLRLMLADARLWAFGHAKPLSEMLTEVRNHLQTIGIENLSDVEFRCLTLYYDSVDVLDKISNFVNPEFRTVFPDFNADKSAELKKIREVLQILERLRFVPIALQMELKYCSPGPGLRDLVFLSSEMAKTLDSYKNPALRFRSVILRKTIADILEKITPQMSLQERNSYEATLKLLKDTAVQIKFPSWDLFTPVIAFDHILGAILLSKEFAELERVDRILGLGQFAQIRNDHTKTNQAFIKAREVALAFLLKVKSTEEEPAAKAKLRSVQESMIKFHQQTTKMLFFEAFALGDYVTTLFVQFQDYDGILKTIDEFEDANPEFAVPSIQARLYNQAAMVSRARTYTDRLAIYEKKHEQWLVQSQYMGKAGGFADEAIMNPDYAAHFMDHNSPDVKTRGDRAIGLILRWLANDWKRGLISLKDCKEMLYPGIEDAPDDPQDAANNQGGPIPDFVAYVDQKEASKVANSIRGSVQTPARTQDFMATYNRLLNWITRRDQQERQENETLWVKTTSGNAESSMLSAKLFALRIFLESRLNMLRHQKVVEIQSREINADDLDSYLPEFQALQELKVMEDVEKGSTADSENQKLESAIHIALFKCGVPKAVEEGLIDKAELLARVDDCKKLNIRYRNSNHLVFQYRSMCQLLHLYWLLYLHFHGNPEALTMPAREAHELYLQLRKSIVTLDPSEQLVVSIRLSEQFLHRQHFNYALASTYTLMKKHYGQEEEAQYRDEFLTWTLRSKGRGFTDLLDTEIGVDKTVQQIEESQHKQQIPESVEIKPVENGNGASVLNNDSLIEDNMKNLSLDESKHMLDADTISSNEIITLLRNLPDKVVVVDFIHLAVFHPENILVAILYRKDAANTIIEVPGISMRKIWLWLRKNIVGSRRPRPSALSQADADKRMEELAPLLAPIVDASVKGSIQEDETVVFCPTQILNRVPMHAIPVNGVPFIERNPVAFCQSLSILHRLVQRFKASSPQDSRGVLVNPLPDHYPSTKRVEALAKILQANILHGLEYKPADVIQAVQGARIFHYHGHVEWNPMSALNSKMLLYDPRPEKKPDTPVKKEVVTARAFFSTKLGFRGLATVIGCGSGITGSTSNDEILGFPTALFYSGASSVVSTLWPILDDDGVEFALAFYRAVGDQERRIFAGQVEDRNEGNEKGLDFSKLVDVTRAVQDAVLDLRKSLKAKNKLLPYHWAAFTLNGFWFLDVGTVFQNAKVEEQVGGVQPDQQTKAMLSA